MSSSPSPRPVLPGFERRRGVALLAPALLASALVAPPASSAMAPGMVAVDTTLATDTFTRTLGSGWGSAVTGGAWTATLGASRLSVDGSRGRMALAANSGAQANLGAISTGDVTASVSVRLSKLPTSGTGHYLGPVVRASGKEGYRLSARVEASGRVSLGLIRVTNAGATAVTLRYLATPLTVAANEAFSLRLTASGSTSVSLTGEAWKAGGAPAAVTAVDSNSARIATGSPALWGYSDVAEGAAISFDELVVTTPGPGTPTTGGIFTSAPAPAAGSLPVGQARYAAPAGALYVASTGSDTSSGSLSAPLRTIGQAVARAGSGGTIVMRAGNYNETVMVPREKRLTIQNYPGEEAWLDGSSDVTGFVASGATWVKSGWTYDFDHSPTEVRGAPDGTGAWQWINPAYPMAAYPDQVWIDGAPQRQVGSAGAVVPGTFYVDTGGDRLVLGTNPSGRSVRASTRQVGLTVLSAGTVLRGFGVRRFAPSVPDFGAIKFYGASGVRLENMVITQNATLGLKMGGDGIQLDRITIADNGQLGVGIHTGKNVSLSNVLIQRNNAERFNGAPSAGGFKFTRSENVTVRDSIFADNYASGLWFDESSYNVVVTRSHFTNNQRHGLIFELSSRATAANNVISGNAETSMLVLDSDTVRLWNNAITGGYLPMRISDGPRTATGNPLVTGAMRNVEVRNNFIGKARPGTSGQNWCALACVTDDRRILTAEQMNASLDGNVYFRNSTSELPYNTVGWSAGTSGTRYYSTLASFQAATRQELHGLQAAGTVPSGGAGVPVPSDIAGQAGLPSGTYVGPNR